jgi:hypothetical protein
MSSSECTIEFDFGANTFQILYLDETQKEFFRKQDIRNWENGFVSEGENKTIEKITVNNNTGPIIIYDRKNGKNLANIDDNKCYFYNVEVKVFAIWAKTQVHQYFFYIGIEDINKIQNEIFKEWYSKNFSDNHYKYEGGNRYSNQIIIKTESATGGRRRKSKKKQRKTRKQSKLRKNKSKRFYKY